MADDPDSIARFLTANPGFLAARPALYGRLEPPARVHGERLADHMAAMLAQARAHAAAMQRHAESVLAAGRAQAAMQDRVQTAVLAALAASDLADWVEHALPAQLGVDAAVLCGEGVRPPWRSLPTGRIARLLEGRAVRCRHRPADAVLLHAEAAELAERDVLVALPGPAPALLALVSRDAAALPWPAASPALAFLGRALATLLADA